MNGLLKELEQLAHSTAAEQPRISKAIVDLQEEFDHSTSIANYKPLLSAVTASLNSNKHQFHSFSTSSGSSSSGSSGTGDNSSDGLVGSVNAKLMALKQMQKEHNVISQLVTAENNAKLQESLNEADRRINDLKTKVSLALLQNL